MDGLWAESEDRREVRPLLAPEPREREMAVPPGIKVVAALVGDSGRDDGCAAAAVAGAADAAAAAGCAECGAVSVWLGDWCADVGSRMSVFILLFGFDDLFLMCVLVCVLSFVCCAACECTSWNSAKMFDCECTTIEPPLRRLPPVVRERERSSEDKVAGRIFAYLSVDDEAGLAVAAKKLDRRDAVGVSGGGGRNGLDSRWPVALNGGSVLAGDGDTNTESEFEVANADAAEAVRAEEEAALSEAPDGVEDAAALDSPAIAASPAAC